jgi:hypothetical protein
MAETADRHVLYELAVQTADLECVFIDRTFRELRGRAPRAIKEDFAGTCNLACEWVRSDAKNSAVAVDLDQDVLAWGDTRHVAGLNDAQRQRLEVRHGNVLTEGGQDLDALIAFNFSYWVFKTRAELVSYFKFARTQLADDGVLFLDCFGGYEAQKEMKERREIDGEDDFEYVWDQAAFNPITHDYTCHIHFRFQDGSRMKEAFTYHWRLWMVPEIRELLAEAGFARTLVYWQGWDEDEEEGSDEYEVVEDGDADPGWVCYIVALV